MSETKHTPGPWLIDPSDNAVYADDSAGCVIALMGTPTLPPRDPRETAANARLISAAPELLEALTNTIMPIVVAARVLRLCPDGVATFSVPGIDGPMEVDNSELAGWLDAVESSSRAAIRKARGEE